MSTLQTPIVGWFLEGFFPGNKQLMRVPILNFPFRVGRSPDLMLTIRSTGVSWTHAELVHERGCVHLRDLGSTNGTFVNSVRISSLVPLNEGDVIHFASVEFRLGHESFGELRHPTLNTSIHSSGLSNHFFNNPRAFRDMLSTSAVRVVFQPIVRLDAAVTRMGYEALGRSDAPGMPASPIRLFSIAAGMEAEEELSRLLRRRAVEEAATLPERPLLFLNSRPVETHNPDLLAELAELRSLNSKLTLVLEIHEAAVTDPPQMRALAERLSDIDVSLAYDDFGAGQARLIELVEAPPRFLKFDISLIRNIHLASAQKHQMVSTLVKMVLDFGIVPLAEGVERPEEAEICRQLGFACAQGYHFGRPAAAATWAPPTVTPPPVGDRTSGDA